MNWTVSAVLPTPPSPRTVIRWSTGLRHQRPTSATVDEVSPEAAWVVRAGRTGPSSRPARRCIRLVGLRRLRGKPSAGRRAAR